MGPATLSQLAATLDPSSGHVMISGHSPLTGSGWTEASVPLTAQEALCPSRLHVCRLQFDALVGTSKFLATVDRLDGFGGLVRQFAKPPRADVSFDDPRAEVRMARYRAFGLRLGFELPHRHEDALIFALDQAVLTQALSRLALG